MRRGTVRQPLVSGMGMEAQAALCPAPAPLSFLVAAPQITPAACWPPVWITADFAHKLSSMLLEAILAPQKCFFGLSERTDVHQSVESASAAQPDLC